MIGDGNIDGSDGIDVGVLLESRDRASCVVQSLQYVMTDEASLFYLLITRLIALLEPLLYQWRVLRLPVVPLLLPLLPRLQAVLLGLAAP